MRKTISSGSPLAMAALAALALGGCALDNDIESGKYRCEVNSDCAWGWTCAATAAGTKACVNLGGSDAGIGSGDGSSADSASADGANADSASADSARPDASAADSAPSACTANLARCAGIGHFERCNAAGNGYLAAEPCPDGERCEKGVCLSAGTVTGYVSVLGQVYYDTFSRKLLGHGSVGATFSYNDKVYSSIKPPALGSCTTYTIPTAGTPTDVAFDAGDISVSGMPSGPRTLRFDAINKRYVLSPALAIGSFPWGATLTFSGKAGGLVHQPWTVKVTTPTRRDITSPTYASSHRKTSPLPITWTGAASGKTLLLDLHDSGLASAVRCHVDDTGSFTVPASYLANFDVNSPITIVLMETLSSPLAAKGLTVGYATGALASQSSVVISAQ